MARRGRFGSRRESALEVSSVPASSRASLTGRVILDTGYGFYAATLCSLAIGVR